MLFITGTDNEIHEFRQQKIAREDLLPVAVRYRGEKRICHPKMKKLPKDKEHQEKRLPKIFQGDFLIINVYRKSH